jgi:hypothetical protein
MNKKQETFVEALCTIFRKKNILTDDTIQALKKAFKESSKENFEDFLLEEGLVSRSQLLNALSEHYKLPAFDVVGYFFDRDLVRKYPKDFLLRNAVIPLELDQNILTVVVGQPKNPDLIPQLESFASYDTQLLVGLERDITDAVKEFYDTPVTEEIPQDQDIHAEHRQEKEVDDLSSED